MQLECYLVFLIQKSISGTQYCILNPIWRISLWIFEDKNHMLNMELDVQSLFGHHVHSCTHWLRHATHPPPPHLGSNTRALLVSKKDEISLWPSDKNPRNSCKLKGQISWYCPCKSCVFLFSLGTEMFAPGLGRDAINNDEDVNAATDSHGQDPQNGSRGRQSFNSILFLLFVCTLAVVFACVRRK